MISSGIKAAPYFCDGYIIQPEILRTDKGKKNKNCEPMIEKAKEILGKLGELAESRK